MFDNVKEKLGAPTAIMASAATATALSEHVDWLPKGPAMLILGGMFSIVLFFVKRDYGRINDGIERHDKELVAAASASAARATHLEGELRAQAAAHAADMQKLQSDFFLALADYVKVKEAGTSSSKIYDRINTESRNANHRLTVIETKLGMHDNVRPTPLSDEDLDKTPPMGAHEVATMLKPNALAWLAKQLVGINANGNSEIVNKMRRAVDGVAAGEPWCACFVQYCAREVDDLMQELAITPDATFLQNLVKTESTQILWERALQGTKSIAPSIGSVVVWRQQSHPEFGHCGIVVGVMDNGDIATIEGNTSMPGASAGSTESERNGRGVWRKVRLGGNIPGFERLGYILPWG